MKRASSKKVSLTRETLHALDPKMPKVAAAGAIRCSVQICPLTNPSEANCTAGCSGSTCTPTC